MTKKKEPQSAATPEPAAPAPEAVKEFDSLLAQATRKEPEPPRLLQPIDLGKIICDRFRVDDGLRPGACLEFKGGDVRFERPADEDHDYVLEAVVSAGDKAAAEAALNAAIRAAQPGRDQVAGEVWFFLHAVTFPERRGARIPLKYIFRQRPDEASADRR